MSSILFVEDDDTIALGVENLLEISGYEVHHFNSAEHALKNLPVWDLAVLDVMLPGMDGVELLKHLKRQSPEKPIILLTAKANTRDIIQGLDGGANDYVTKPFQIGELLARIRTRLRDTQLSEHRTQEQQSTTDHIFELGESTVELYQEWLPRFKEHNAKLLLVVHDSIELKGDPKLLYDALSNLLSNALKYRHEQRALRCEIAARLRANMVEISVTDNGMGVPNAHRKRIFERFVRIEGPNRGFSGGHGLGLSFVQEAAIAHGGIIRCTDGYQGGAKFQMRIPK